jgi:hypothetical protein
MTPTPERLTLPRVLDYDTAEQMNGQRVPALVPTLPTGRTGAYVVHDADTGAPVLAVFPLEQAAAFRRAVLQIEIASVGRANNYASRSRTFGYRPRRATHFRESCGITSLANEQPGIERLLEAYADQFSGMLDVIDPTIAPADTARLAEVRTEWRFGEAKLWTSGVVNDTAQLPYHRDRFNFSTWSAMPVVRRGVRGGHLHLPEYDAVLPCADSTVILFPGERLLHGVTPLERVKAGEGYRISVVYYALKGMKTCLEYAQELAQGAVARTAREADMAARLAAGDTAIPGSLENPHKGKAHRAGGARENSTWSKPI